MRSPKCIPWESLGPRLVTWLRTVAKLKRHPRWDIQGTVHPRSESGGDRGLDDVFRDKAWTLFSGDSRGWTAGSISLQFSCLPTTLYTNSVLQTWNSDCCAYSNSSTIMTMSCLCRIQTLRQESNATRLYYPQPGKTNQLIGRSCTADPGPLLRALIINLVWSSTEFWTQNRVL